MGGYRFGKFQTELHLRRSGLVQGVSFQIGHFFCSEIKGAQIRAYDLQNITCVELVVQRAKGNAVLITFFHLGNDLSLPDITGILGVLTGFAVVEAGGVDPVGHMIHFIPPDLVDGTAGIDVIDHMAVCAGDDGGIVGGLCPAFNLDAVNAHINQIL